MNDPIVVSGIGVVSAAGVGVDAFWTSALSGRAACSFNDLFPLGEGVSRAAGLIRDFEPETAFRWEGPAAGLEQDRLCGIARAAIHEALESAGLVGPESVKPLAETALYVSTAIGPMGTMEKAVAARRDGRVGGYSLKAFSLNRFVAHLVQHSGAGGAYALIPTGCTGGCDALGYAIAAIRSRVTRRAIVGAFEAPVTPLVVAAFARINATSTRECLPEEASCPFDIGRDGFVLGEGGGAIVVETLSAALERGAQPLAVVSGYGSVSSAFHMTDIQASGEPIARSIRSALIDSGLNADAIDHINLHGSSTPQNDLAETNAVMDVFGPRGAGIPVTSLKSQTGHALAAANGVEIVASVLSLRNGAIPPTANQRNRDPACNLNVVDQPEYVTVNHILKTASGFSGIHSAIILSRYEV